MNLFVGIGRVGKDDAVTRFTQNGKAVTSFSLAVDRGFGENKQTVWFDCSAWGERFEKVAPHILKGNQLGVSGEVGTKEHNGKTYLTLDVKEVTLLGTKERQADQPSKQGQKPANTAGQIKQGGFADDDIGF